jgi:hypothetical protein
MIGAIFRGRFVMIRRITVVGLVIYSMFVSFAFAGTWIDDFEDGNLHGWKGVDVNWVVEHGECSGQWANALAGWAECIECGIENSASLRDYGIVCRAKLVEKLAGVSPHFGIRFRMGPGDGRGDYEAYIDLEEEEGVFCIAPFQKMSEVRLPFDIVEETWYKLEVIAEGDHFEFFIDDEQIGSFDNASRPSGSVGLEVANAHVHFDDVVITGPEIPDGGPGFAVASQSKLATMWGSVKRCP